MAEDHGQGCLFEEDYLVRALRPIANNPDVALTELVANAWDSGASSVEIVIPEAYDDFLTIQDDGTGMTASEFHKKWMTLGYDRVRNQGDVVQFPPGREGWKRPAYGRNGVGRHGMLCFGPEYLVETTKDGLRSIFDVATTSGDDPFRIVSQRNVPALGHGTRLSVRIERNLPFAGRLASVLGVRFLHDPRFKVSVNGHFVPLAEHSGLVNKRMLRFGLDLTAEAFFVDSTRAAKSTQYQGVAFWVGNRLVGDPAWAIGGTVFLDGRTRIAKRYTVVVKTDALFDDVLPDWEGFKKTENVKSLLAVVSSYVQEVYAQLSEERIAEVRETILRAHKDELRGLPSAAKREVVDFLTGVTDDNPTIPQESLSAAVKAVIALEKTRSGSALLEKLSKFTEDDVAGLDRLLREWTVRDALTVLDEIDRRIAISSAIEKFSSDPKADELHVLHPLVLESRWLFGPEFDSPEFVSNVTLNTALRVLFSKEIEGQISNPRKRADIISLAERSISAVATEDVREDSGIPTMTQILLIELKRGGSELTRENVTQAENYLQDLLTSNLIDGNPRYRAYVIGHSIAKNVITEKELAGSAKLHVMTFGQLVRLANKRLFRLKEKLQSRYDTTSEGSSMLSGILAEPQQFSLNQRPPN